MGNPRSRLRTHARILAVLGILLGTGLLGGLLVASAPAAATPWGGPEPGPTNLLFFLHNDSRGVAVGDASYLDILSTANDTVAPYAGHGSESLGAHYDSVAFVVAPQLAGPLLLNGTLVASLYLNQSGSSPNGGSVTLAVRALAPSGAATLLGSGPALPTSALGAGGSLPQRMTVTGPTLPPTSVPAGDSIQINISISGNTAEFYGIWWGAVGGTYYLSSVAMPVSTYLEVAAPTVRSASGAVGTSLVPDAGNSTVTVIGVVSDPLGAYDFSPYSVDFTVESPNGSILFGPVPMLPTPSLAADGAPNGTYAIAYNYTSLARGVYDFSINATDATNHNLWGQDTLPEYYGRAAVGVQSITVGLPAVPVSVSVVDDHGLPVPQATVRVLSQGIGVGQNETNLSGGAAFRLPGGSTYLFDLSWQGVPVGSFPEAIGTVPGHFQLAAAVIYPTLHLVTPGGAALAYALVTVVHPNGTVLPLHVSSGSGMVALGRAPAGNYSVTVVYDSAVVLTGDTVAVRDDGPTEVVVSGIYPFAVECASGAGSPLPGVFVEIRNTSSGATIASGVTNGSGTLTFLLPAGAYAVTGTWAATYDLSSVSQTVSARINWTGSGSERLDFSRAYPAFTATNEFFVVVGYVVLGALLVVLIVLVARRRGRSPVAPPPPGPAGGSPPPGPAP